MLVAAFTWGDLWRLALAVFLLERRSFTPTDFQRFHPGGKLGARLCKACSLMHTGEELPVVPVGTVLSTAIVEMTSKRFGITGVVDESGNLVGVLTDGDLRTDGCDADLFTATGDRFVRRHEDSAPWVIHRVQEWPSGQRSFQPGP